MKIILAGGGKLGATLIRQLTAEGGDVTLIDSDPAVLENVQEQYDVMTLCGNCAVRDTLVQAGIGEADLLIAVTGTDEVNLLSCLTAHGINPALHTIARIRNPEYSGQIYEMRDIFPLSMSVNPDKQAAKEIERLLKYPGFLKLDTFAKGRVEIAELRIEEDSKLCGVTLGDLHGIIQCRVLVCAVLRQGEVMTPSGDFELREGDRIFVTAPTNVLSQLLSDLGILSRRARRVMICGGGRSSFYLAEQLLKSRMTVKIIEQDRARCEQLSELLPDAEIINADATNRLVLESEGLSGYDAVVSLTGMDELNIVISLYAHANSVPQIITKLGRVDDTRVLDQLSLGSVISPKELCCSGIVRYVRAIKNQTGAAAAVHFIADGKAEAIEFRVDKNALRHGVPLRDLRLKRGVLIACITHGSRTEIPDGSSVFSPGDTVVVVTNRNSTILTLNDIFE
ncbi:MAG: Trk system potassium transporter TrkA [Clostridia bacterium]|nr:Trk system potassium transporter TrkA [Clostridia bacterium]